MSWFKTSRIKGYLEGAAVAVPCFGLLIAQVIQHGENRECMELYKQATVVADINKDGLTSHDEWGRVYKEIGLQYDITESHPRKDLSREQLERIISQYK